MEHSRQSSTGQNSNPSNKQVSSLIEDAQAMVAQGRHDEARTLFAAGVVLEDGIEARNAYGCNLYSVEDYSAAIEQFSIILEQAKRQESNALWTVASNNLTAVYRRMGDTVKAADFQRQSITAECRLDEFSSNDAALACDFTNRATDAILAGHYELAARLLRQSLQIELNEESATGAASDWGNLGILLALTGELEEAVRLLWRAYRLHLRGLDYQGAGTDLMNLAEFYRDLGRWNDVVACLRRATEHFQHAGAAGSRSNADQRLSEALRFRNAVNHDPLLN